MTDAVIEIQGVTRTLGERIVLSGINLLIERGEVFGYLGPNGAGKTTTLRILLGLIRPTTGRALVLGQDVTQMGREVKARIGVALEDHGLYERLSAYQNLDYYGRIFRLSKPTCEARIEALLRQADLWTVRNARVGTFSRGMKQRLALARALLPDPELIFLDEPTSGLDPEATAAIRKLILHLSQEKQRTIFLNSHDLDEVERICSQIVILNQGRIQAQGTVESLRRQFSQPMVELSLGEGETEQALPILTSLPFVTGCQSADHRITVELKDAAAKPELLRALVEQAVSIQEMRQIDRTLEDVYFSIVQGAERNNA